VLVLAILCKSIVNNPGRFRLWKKIENRSISGDDMDISLVAWLVHWRCM